MDFEYNQHPKNKKNNTDGEPVQITVPGANNVSSLQKLIISATDFIISLVLLSCIILPLTIVLIFKFCGSCIVLVNTILGPNGENVS